MLARYGCRLGSPVGRRPDARDITEDRGACAYKSSFCIKLHCSDVERPRNSHVALEKWLVAEVGQNLLLIRYDTYLERPDPNRQKIWDISLTTRSTTAGRLAIANRSRVSIRGRPWKNFHTCGSITVQNLVVVSHTMCAHLRDPKYSGIACIDPRQTGFVGKGSDCLQLIKFWPFYASRKGVCGGEKIFGSAIQPARSVCVSLSAFFINNVYAYFPTACYVVCSVFCLYCMLHHPAAFYYPTVRSCVSVTMNSRRGSCGFCPSFTIHEHTAAGGGYQQSRNKFRLGAKTVTIEITLAFTSDWRTTNANNITSNPLLAVTHLAPPCAPRSAGPGVLRGSS